MTEELRGLLDGLQDDLDRLDETLSALRDDVNQGHLEALQNPEEILRRLGDFLDPEGGA